MTVKYSLFDDLIKSIIPAIILTIISALTINYRYNQTDLTLFITIVTAFFGVLLTVLAILYAFEDSFKNNPAIKALGEEDRLTEIYSRFTDTIFGLFYALIILIILYFTNSNTPTEFTHIGFFIITTTTIFSLLRTYRCFYLFKLLQISINKNK